MTVRLDGIDLVIFDKDGTLIDFGTMWSGWAETLADRLGEATGRPVDGPLFAMLGYDPVARRVTPGGGLAATPMARLRERTRDVLVGAGVPAEAAEERAGDRVARARPAGARAPAGRSRRAVRAAPGKRAAGRGGHHGRPRTHGPDVRRAGADGRDRRARLRRRRRRGQAGAGHGRPPVRGARRAAGADRGRGRFTGRPADGPCGGCRAGCRRADRRRRARRPGAAGRCGARLGRRDLGGGLGAARSDRPSCDRPSGGA